MSGNHFYHTVLVGRPGFSKGSSALFHLRTQRQDNRPLVVAHVLGIGVSDGLRCKDWKMRKKLHNGLAALSGSTLMIDATYVVSTQQMTYVISCSYLRINWITDCE